MEFFLCKALNNMSRRIIHRKKKGIFGILPGISDYSNCLGLGTLASIVYFLSYSFSRKETI
jgi:hypothetical protein